MITISHDRFNTHDLKEILFNDGSMWRMTETGEWIAIHAPGVWWYLKGQHKPRHKRRLKI